MMLPERAVRLREGRPWATNVALAALGCGLLGLCRQIPIEWDHFVIGFSGCSGWSAIVYLAAVGVVLTQPTNRWTFRIVLGFAVAFQAMVLFSDPLSSTDMYRYVWDGIVQHAHINPYRYVPGDAALKFLRDPNQDIYDNINRRDYARTIYPPVAQMVYWLVTFFSPTVTAMKAAMLGFIVVAGAGLITLLRLLGRRREEILLFAWCPLMIWEVGLAGHVDAVVTAFVVLALLFRYKEKPLWTGVFLGLAIFTKFYPAVLFPALYMRRDWKMPAVIVAIGVVGYSVYSSAGRYILGFVSGYRKEEGMDSGTRYFLLEITQRLPGLHNLPVAVYMAFCVLVFGALTVWALRSATTERIPSVWSGVGTPVYLRVAMAFAFALMILFSPHYPWYVIWLLPFFVLMPNVPLAAYLMGLFYLLTTDLADGSVGKTYLLNKRLYGVLAIAFLVQLVIYRWPIRRHFVLTREKARQV